MPPKRAQLTGEKLFIFIVASEQGKAYLVLCGISHQIKYIEDHNYKVKKKRTTNKHSDKIKQATKKHIERNSEMSVTLINEYDAHIDMKKRITLRDAGAEYYAVKMFDDGHIILEPRVLVSPDLISKRTLKMLDRSASNFKNGKVSDPINLSKYL